jgi:hypothetical protein
MNAGAPAEVLIIQAFGLELVSFGSRLATPYMTRTRETFGVTVPAISMSSRALLLRKN